MPRAFNCPSFRGSNISIRPCVLRRQQRPQRPPCRCYTQSSAGVQAKSHPKPDHTHLIDPTSLRNTLEAVREANRATLIRRVGPGGKSIRSTSLTHSHSAGLSQPSWLKGHAFERRELPVSQKQSRKPPRKKARLETSGRGPAAEIQSGDYAGVEYPVQAEWRVTADTEPRWQRPWLSLMKGSGTKPDLTAEQRLRAEIDAFTDYFSPRPYEKLAAEVAFGDIKEALDSAKDPYSTELVGSRVTGLAGPLSDLDINITSVTGARLDEIRDRDQMAFRLGKLSGHLRKSRSLTLTERVRRHARVPILIGIHQATSLEFQIQSTNSIYNTTEYAKLFMKEYPTLRSLFLVIKQMLSMRALCVGGGEGGLTSYPLLNMIVACLKLKCDHLEPNDVAGQLLCFLDLYADIDFYTTGISVLPPELFSISTEDFKRLQSAEDSDQGTVSQSPKPMRGNVSHRMYLVDPADPSHDLGSGASMIKHIQATLIKRRAVLRAKMRYWDTTAEDDPQKSLLGCLVEGDYKPFELDRASLKTTLDWQLNDGEAEFTNDMDEWEI